MQVDCQDFLSTNLMQVVSTTYSKSVNIKLRLIFTDLLQLDEAKKLDATSSHSCMKPVKSTIRSTILTFLPV